MELVEGSTLADRIAQGAIPVDEALPIAKRLLDRGVKTGLETLLASSALRSIDFLKLLSLSKQLYRGPNVWHLRQAQDSVHIKSPYRK